MSDLNLKMKRNKELNISLVIFVGFSILFIIFILPLIIAPEVCNPPSNQFGDKTQHNMLTDCENFVAETEVVGSGNVHIVRKFNDTIKYQFLENGVRIFSRETNGTYTQVISEIRVNPQYKKQQGVFGDFIWNDYGLNSITTGNNVLDGWNRVNGSDGSVTFKRNFSGFEEGIEEFLTETWVFENTASFSYPKVTLNMTSNRGIVIDKGVPEGEWRLTYEFAGINSEFLNDSVNSSTTKRNFGNLSVDWSDFQNDFNYSEVSSSGKASILFFPTGTNGTRFIDPLFGNFVVGSKHGCTGCVVLGNFTTTEAGTLDNITVRYKGGGGVSDCSAFGVIYSDDGAGAPDTLLANSTGVDQGCTEDWYNFSVVNSSTGAKISLTADTIFWIGFFTLNKVDHFEALDSNEYILANDSFTFSNGPPSSVGKSILDEPGEVLSVAAYFTPTAADDTTPPQWFDNTTNSTLAGTNIKHSVRWTDDTALSGFIFSFDNGTGTFTNDSFVLMTGTNNFSNATKGVNITVGATIQWRIYANDTNSSNPFNATDIFVYNTTSADSCSCPAINNNFEINLSDSCQIFADCNIGNGNISFVSTGNATFNATITALNMNPPPDNAGVLFIGAECRVILG